MRLWSDFCDTLEDSVITARIAAEHYSGSSSRVGFPDCVDELIKFIVPIKTLYSPAFKNIGRDLNRITPSQKSKWPSFQTMPSDRAKGIISHVYPKTLFGLPTDEMQATFITEAELREMVEKLNAVRLKILEEPSFPRAGRDEDFDFILQMKPRLDRQNMRYGTVKSPKHDGAGDSEYYQKILQGKTEITSRSGLLTADLIALKHLIPN